MEPGSASARKGDPLKTRPSWCSLEILGGRPFESDGLSEEKVESLRDLFETDAASEYDARHLYAHLAPRLAGFSEPVRRFLALWRDDEENHYRGLRRLLSVATGDSEAEIDARMALRAPDFTALAPFIDDPFSLLVTFAYDERVTVQAYAMDYDLYSGLGVKPGKWVRKTNRDEALHYRNAVSLLRSLYPDRLSEAKAILDNLVAFDERRDRYRATFLLDHDDGDLYFTHARLRRCATLVDRTLRGGLLP